jgi:hypothetical protein
MVEKTSTTRTALVLCDIQPDLLGSLPNRDALLTGLKIILEIARAKKWVVFYSGLKFQTGTFTQVEGTGYSHYNYTCVAFDSSLKNDKKNRDND